MSKIAEMRKWREEVFAPWQQAAEKFADKQQQNNERIRRHGTEIKTMVALIMDGQPQKAADLWNKVGFEPALRSVSVVGNDTLELTLLNDETQEVALDDLLADLQGLLS